MEQEKQREKWQKNCGEWAIETEMEMQMKKQCMTSFEYVPLLAVAFLPSSPLTLSPPTTSPRSDKLLCTHHVPWIWVSIWLRFLGAAWDSSSNLTKDLCSTLWGQFSCLALLCHSFSLGKRFKVCFSLCQLLKIFHEWFHFYLSFLRSLYKLRFLRGHLNFALSWLAFSRSAPSGVG